MNAVSARTKGKLKKKKERNKEHARDSRMIVSTASQDYLNFHLLYLLVLAAILKSSPNEQIAVTMAPFVTEKRGIRANVELTYVSM